MSRCTSLCSQQASASATDKDKMMDSSAVQQVPGQPPLLSQCASLHSQNG